MTDAYNDQPPTFQRPADPLAERILAASIMARPELIDDLADTFDPVDFTDQRLAWVWHAVDELRNTLDMGPVPWHAVDQQLRKWRAEGYLPIVPLPGPMLSELYAEAQPSSAAWFAARISKAAVAGRLVDLGLHAQHTGMSPAFTADKDLPAIQSELDAVIRGNTGNTPRLVGDLLAAAIERATTPHTTEDRIPTGLTDLDHLTGGGFAPGRLIIVGARPGVGKALALDTPLPTPAGWTTMGDVQVGDWVMGADGKPTQVTFATEVQHGRDCFEVEFSDGSAIVADAEHLWLTDTRASLKSAWSAATGYNRHKNQRTFAAVRTTEEIAATLRTTNSDQRLNHSVINAKPLDLPQADLPIDPYVLGVWLGDGATATARISTADAEIVDAIRMAGYQVNKIAGDNYDYGILGLQAQLRAAGLLGNKHIPQQYLRASESQRRALLAGLLDTDGYARADGLIQFAVTHRQLADGTRELISSLGYRTRLCLKSVKGRSADSSTCYTITFSTSDKAFRLTRKLARQKTEQYAHARRRFITDVRPVASVPVRCIQVDNADHLYLAGRTMIPTHNTTLGQGFARAAAIHHQIPTLFSSLEMGEDEIMNGILSAEGSVPLHHIANGSVDDAGAYKLAKEANKLAAAPLFIDDATSVSLPSLRGQVRQLTRTAGLRMVIVDYLQLMQAPKAESRQVAVSALSRGLKLLAKEFRIVVIVLAQLNRGSEQRTDKRPVISDLRESGAIEQDADMVILVHRPDMHEPESARAGEADLIVDKHRGGPRATITAAWQGHYARLFDMAAEPRSHWTEREADAA